MNTNLALRIARIADVATHIKLFELRHVDGAELPAFEAGAHVELQLPNHLSRSYSLLNDPRERQRYLIGVHRAADSGGGSRHLHEVAREGDVLLASAPRNNFSLDEAAARSVLLAGGIGVTPLIAMAHRLCELGRPWQLHYCAATRADAAFTDELQTLAEVSGGHLALHFSKEQGGSRLDIAELVASSAADAHFYCCGPRRMLEAFEQATLGCRERAHVEYFSARSKAAREGGFTIELARSRLTLQVSAGRSILDVVTDAGINVPTSCREGICGSCETRILEGEADHRDALLSEQEQAQNQSMMICCSGARSARLVLDL